MELFPSNSNFNFMRARVVSLALAFLIMVVAIGAMAVNGFNYGLDFTGGTVAEPWRFHCGNRAPDAYCRSSRSWPGCVCWPSLLTRLMRRSCRPI